MKVLHYDYFTRNKRLQLVKECADSVKEGLTIFYILPSREAMFHVRRLFTKELGGIFNCYIIGFADLEKLVINGHYDENAVMGELEQKILLQQVLKEIPPSSPFFYVKDKPGFIALLIRTIRRLKRLNVLPSDFLVKTSFLQGELLKKCQGLAAIYACYEDMKAEQGLMDIDDISLLAVKVCKETTLFNGTGKIVVDGFINIDPVNVNLLESIITQNPDTDICVNVPYKNNNNEQFLLNEVIKDCERLGFVKAQNTGASTRLAEDTKSLADSLYAGTGNISSRLDALTIQNSPCMDHEIRTAAGKIKELIQSQAIPPSDIAIITADLANYRPKIAEVCKEYGIPLHKQTSVAFPYIPVIKDILALWKLANTEENHDAQVAVVTSKYLLPEAVLAQEGFRTGKLFSLAEAVLKSGQGNNFFACFMNRYSENNDNEAAKTALSHYLNSVTAFVDRLTEDPGSLLMNFTVLVNSLPIEKNISALYRNGVLDGELWLRNERAFQQFVSMLERVLAAYSKYGANREDSEYEGILRDIVDMISNMEIDNASRDVGGVRLIAPDLVKGQDYDSVFILGVNEGVFPALSDNVLFTNYEVKSLFDLGINLDCHDWELEREKLRFNSCIAAARNRLHLSYRTADEDGCIMIASPFIAELESVLAPGSISEAASKLVSMRDRMCFESETYSLGELVKSTNSRLKRNVSLKKEAVNSLTREKFHYLAHAASVEYSREFGSELDCYDGKLSNRTLVEQDARCGFSASQLNSYSRCPFSYFAERVLGISVENKKAQDAMDIGTFYHAVLSAYHQNNENPMEPDLNRLHAILDAADNYPLSSVPVYLQGFLKAELHETLASFVTIDAQNMSRYYQNTGYRLKPVLLEEPFSVTLGKAFRGTVDRIDLELDDAGSYTGRFILYDYKKGKIKGIKECIEGSDFQLPLYHAAFKNLLQEKFNIANPECVALLYYSIQNHDWNGIIRKDIKAALFDGRRGTTSTPEKANMDVVLRWSEQEAMRVVHSIQTGDFAPLIKCPATDDVRCPYSGMCRYDRIRFANKVGVNND